MKRISFRPSPQPSPLRERELDSLRLLGVGPGWGFFFLLISLLWLGGATAVAAQSPANEIFTMVNDLRVANGLPAFQYDGTLTAAAQNQASWMAQTGVYSHYQGNGSSPQSRADAAGYVGFVSENIVGGTNLGPREALLWWQNSPSHNQTLLTSRYVHAGVGYALSGNGQRMYVLVVGRPSNQPTSNETDDSAEPIYVAPIEIAAPRADGAIVHVVKTGQTAWALAARYDIPLSELLYLNSLGNNPTLTIGDEIYIRLAEGQAPPPTPTPALSHIVQEGQTLWTIAAIYDLQLSDLLWFNSLSPEEILRPGDEVRIRWPADQPLPPTPTPQMTHIIKTGDSAWAIALQYGLTLEQLLAYNNMTEGALLLPGNELWIRPTFTPVASPTSEATATAIPATNTPAPTATHTVTPPAPRSALLAPPPTATAVPPTNNLSQTLYSGSMIASVGLLIAAGIIILAMRKGNGLVDE